MAKLDLSRAIAALRTKAVNSGTLLANALSRIEDGLNNLGQQLAAEPVGLADPPSPLQGVNVKAAGEQVHITLAHDVPITKNIHYFVEYTQNDPNFLVPHVVHLGTSRGTVLNLPTKLDGGTTVSYYFRGYPQLPGSLPALPVNFGGVTPTAVNLGGTTALTLQTSTGSGTAAANGQQGGWGFGKTNTRPASGPKRQVA